MKLTIMLLSILTIPRYLVRFLITSLLNTILIIWLFNLTSLLGAGSDPLITLVNFFKYGLNETSILLLLISIINTVYVVIRSYLDRLDKQITLIWPTIILIFVTFVGLLLPIVLSSFGIVQFGGLTRTFTDVMLVLALALSVYSVAWAGKQIEPAIRTEIDHKKS